MASRKKILLPRSDIPGRAPTLNEIDFGEIAINTHDGKAFIKRDRDGEVSIQSIGSEDVDNVYYVSKSGQYGNDGRSLGNSFRTVDSAVERVTALQSFKFNEDICERDLQLIMDAVRYDMVLNTNYGAVTAGNSYKRGNAAKVTNEQKYQTRRAINEERVGMISAPLVAANTVATERIVNAFTEIIDIFYDGEPDDLYFTDPPIEAQTDANAAANALQANRTAIQDAVVTYVNNAYIAPYNQEKCRRDVGLIIDAIADDLVLGTNYNTITAGFSYKRANSAYVLSDQREITIDAINYAIGEVNALVGVTSDATINTLVDNITDVLENPDSATYGAGQFIIDYATTAGSTYQITQRDSATQALQDNRQAIIDAVDSYTQNTLALSGYDSVKCKRDTGFIIDALSYDIKYGGNTASRKNAQAYFVGTKNQLGYDSDEIVNTALAFEHLKVVTDDYILRDSERGRVDTLVDLIVEVINDRSLTNLDAEAGIELGGINSANTTERTTILNGKSTIQDDTIDYVDTNWAIKTTNIKSYDAGKCSRDVGLIIDAVARDLILGTNYNTNTAGWSYKRANSAYVLSDQKEATIKALEFGRDFLTGRDDVVQDSAIGVLFDNVINVLDGTTDTYPTMSYPTTTGATYQTTVRNNAATALQTNRATLISDLSSWIGTNYPNFVYDSAACERDTGYLIDALTHDVKYGGNTASRAAAQAYFVGTEDTRDYDLHPGDLYGQLDSDEVEPTVAAFNQLDTLIDTYVTTSNERTKISDLIGIVTEVLEDRSLNGLDASSEIELGGLGDSEFNAILNNREETQDAVVAYVDENFAQQASLPDYDQQKCYRDTGLILDAVRRDLLIGTDYNTITAAFAYKRANSTKVLTDQLTNTIRAIEFARDETQDLSSVSTDLSTLFKRFTDVLNDYTTEYTTPTYPTTVGSTFQQTLDGERIDFATDVQASRQTLIDDLITWIGENEPTVQYNRAKCERDTGYVLDALCHDIKYGGNTATRQAALSYWEGTNNQLVTSEEIDATVAAYSELKSIIASDITNSYANNATIDNEVDTLITIITTVIQQGVDFVADEIEIDTGGLTTTEFDAIEDGTLQIQDDVIEFVNDLFFNPAYDSEKCHRDVGEIIDALRVALLTQDDFAVQIVRQSYLREGSAEVYNKQRNATLQAVNKLESIILSVTTDATVESELQTHFETIRDGINRADTSELPYPDATSATQTDGGVNGEGVDAETRAVITFFQNNDPTLEDDIITFVNTQVSPYDETKCRRDVDIIFKCIAHDTAVGGDWATTKAARAYFEGVVNQLGNNATEIEATIAAYERIKTQSIDVTFEAQAAGLGITTKKDAIKTYLKNLVDIIIDVIKADDSSTIEDETFPGTNGVLSDRLIEVNALKNNRTQWQNAIIDFVNDSNPVNAFDDEKCRRDTKLIINAIILDLQNNTDYNSITAGLAYRRGNAQKVQDDQLKYTIDSINYLRDLLVGTDGITTTEVATVKARIKQITDLLSDSTAFDAEDGTDVSYDLSNATQDQINAFNALRANRRNLQTQITTWILDNYQAFEYDLKACERDVAYIIDGLCHDLIYGDQYAAETIANSYWVEKDLNIEGNADQTLNLDGEADNYFLQLGQGETTTTVAAYNQLEVFIRKVIPNTSDERVKINELLAIIIGSISATDNTGIPSTFNGITVSGTPAQIKSSKDNYAEDVVAYANKVFPAFTYDQNKCRRDVGFILDALTYDLKYGGNSATSIAMRSYFSIFNNGYGDLLGDNEYTLTIQAYRYLKRNILPRYFDQYADGVSDTKNKLLDIIINAIVQTNEGTFQLGDFFGADRTLNLYEYNYPTGLDAEFDSLVFPDLVARGYKVTFNDLFNVHQEFNVGASQRLTIIRSSNAVAQNQGTDSTIFVKSGDYIINNPIKLPPKTSIIGDALRSVTFRPNSVDSDFFWADNGVYIKEITFRDHQNNAAVLAYDPNVESSRAGPFITQSPYVQNCTSLTSSGIGLRIDGSKVSGLRSMVLDAFTQFNAGGIGVYLLNRGYSQLVSLFTVSTTTSVLTETGGQCSLTNSNSSFGEFGLVSRGGSPKLYEGQLYANYITNDEVIRVNSIITNDSADYTLNLGDFKRPNYNDALKFDSENYYYTVTDVSEEILQDWAQTGNDEESEQLATNSQTNNGMFGYSTHMSIDDKYSLISELKDGAGRVEVYTQDLVGGVPTWSYQALLQATPPFGSNTDSDEFGEKVMLSEDGSLAAISAPGKKQVDATATNKQNGQMYLFSRSGETWTQDTTIQLTGVTDRNIRFGTDFDLSEDGTHLVVTSTNDLNSNQGKAYVYSRPNTSSTTWTLLDTLLCPDGAAASVNEVAATISKDGQDLVLHWRGNINKAYYYQRNIDSKYILAQVIVPKSNFGGERDGVIRMSPNSDYLLFGDRLSPRGYFTNEFTDSDNGVEQRIRRKQELTNVNFSGSNILSTTDTDADFTDEFVTGQTVTIAGSANNNGTYTINDVTANTLTFDEAFDTTGGDTVVQVYQDSSGVIEYFTFFEGQWVTQDLEEATAGLPTGFGFGASLDVSSDAKLAVVGNNPKHDQTIGHSVSVFERKRSDWQRVNTLQPQTPVNISDQGKNDNYGFGGQALACGKGGDLILIGAPEHRQTDTDASTEYGQAFFYYSILDETGAFEITVSPPLNSNKTIDQTIGFHQRSLITASGHTFEYVGSGTNMFTAIPQNGGIPKKENEIVFDSAGAATPNFGLVYFTATDELGDFRIGENLRINREEGTITGDTFDRSLFAVLTPFILALEG